MKHIKIAGFIKSQCPHSTSPFTRYRSLESFIPKEGTFALIYSNIRTRGMFPEEPPYMQVFKWEDGEFYSTSVYDGGYWETDSYQRLLEELADDNPDIYIIPFEFED